MPLREFVPALIPVLEQLGQHVHHLSKRQYNILESLYRFEAFSADSLRTTEEIAKKAEGSEANPEQFKRPIADLKKRGLVGAKLGKGGGCWLTKDGKSLIKRERGL